MAKGKMNSMDYSGLEIECDSIQIGGVPQTVTVTELNQLDPSANIAAMTPGAAITAAAEAYKVSTIRVGNIIKTEIYIDLTGLDSITTNKDIIGKSTDPAHIGQVTTAVNGLIYKGTIFCAEVPATGDDDIDLYRTDDGTGVLSDDASGEANDAVLVTAGGAYSIGMEKEFTAWPAADSYLYLATGDTTAGTYSAGKIIITMWGLVA